MAADWYYAKGGQRHGPVTEEQLRQFAGSGQIQSTDLVWRKGMAEWQQAGSIEGLSFPPQPNAPDVSLPPTMPVSPPPVTAARSPATSHPTVFGGADNQGKVWMKRIGIGLGAFVVLIVLLAVVSSSNDANVGLVKTGHLSAYPNIPIGKAVDGFMGSPRWESGTATDGTEVVNVRGKIRFMEKEVEALLQFEIDPDHETFEVGALEFNGIPQNPLIKAALLEKMYESVGN